MRADISVWTLALLAVVIAGCSPAMLRPSDEPVELRFWAGHGARGDHRVVNVSAHCCCSGEIAIARVSQMPMPGAKDPLEPELVLELTEAGDVLRRWPMPVDLIVAAVKEEQILVPLAPMLGANSDRAILISPRGSVALTTVPPGLPEPVPYTCPLIREFEGSAYLRCFEFRDLSSREARRLALEGPCT
jgi:hypothetical protein